MDTDTDFVDRLSRVIGRSGTRRAALGALLGSVVLQTALGSTAARGKTNQKGKHRGPRRAKRQRGARVQAESKPQIESDHLSFPEGEFIDCGSFKVLIKGELDYTIKWFSDKDGIVVKGVETVSGTDIFINSVTREEIAAPFHNTVLIDPQTGLGANMGIIFKVTVPGSGAVFLDIGRIVTNQLGTIVTFQAGPHQAFDGDFDGLCAALA